MDDALGRDDSTISDSYSSIITLVERVQAILKSVEAIDGSGRGRLDNRCHVGLDQR